jgi:PcfJ-like protein
MRRKATLADTDPHQQLLNHIAAIGLTSESEYRCWCDDNGFSRRLHKRAKERDLELAYVVRTKTRPLLEQRRREQRNPLDVLTSICRGEIAAKEIKLPYLSQFAHRYSTFNQPSSTQRVDARVMIELLEHLYRSRAKFLDGSPLESSLGVAVGNTGLEALIFIAAHRYDWIRDLRDWKAKSRSPRRQFASLLRHLFVRYDDIPAFFDRVWLEGDAREGKSQRRWYIHVGSGKNLSLCDLPIPYTKKMAHHFMRAPSDCSVYQALRWGQIHALGGNERLARAIFGTRLGESFNMEEFWFTVIQWFIGQPMLDPVHVAPIVDYIAYQRFESHGLVAGGEAINAGPVEPNLTMRGRTAEAVLRRVQHWHQRLARDNTIQICQWKPSSITPFEFIEGAKTGENQKRWTIRELVSSKALFTEGRQLKHCVASYAASCARGRCTIWTMEVQSEQELQKLLTIEVRTLDLTICQIRGKCNRVATEKERNVIQRWATKAGLRVAGYV